MVNKKLKLHLICNNSKLQLDILHFFLHLFHATTIFRIEIILIPHGNTHLSFIFIRGPASSLPLDLLSSSVLMLYMYESGNEWLARKYTNLVNVSLARTSRLPIEFIGDALHVIDSRSFGFLRVGKASLHILKSRP